MTEVSSRIAGILYIVATPIGHLDDISSRALSVFNSVDAILAEDTRHSAGLFSSLGIKKPLISLHAHNEATKSQSIIDAMLMGKSYALISDAGTPLISDPGFLLVRLAQANQIRVVPIPGPCAFIAALSAAGVASEIVTFAGFLPAKSSARQRRLEALRDINHTLIFYESTHRIIESIDDIALVFGDTCELVLAKELTKLFERIMVGNCNSIREWLRADDAHCKGEFVLIIPPREVVNFLTEHQHLLAVLLSELPLKQAVSLACKLTGANKNDLYALALTLKE